MLGPLAELGQCIAGSLVGFEHVREDRDDPTGEGDVARLDIDAGGIGERRDDRQQ